MFNVIRKHLTPSPAAKTGFSALLVPVTTGAVPLKVLLVPLTTGAAPLSTLFAPLNTGPVFPATIFIVSLTALYVLTPTATVQAATAPAFASLPSEFGSHGSGAGEFLEPAGVAVDQLSGDLYVTDRKNNRVDEFDSGGGFVRAWGWGVEDGVTEGLQSCTVKCFAGLAGSGEGQFDEPHSVGGIAVDNASEDPLDTSLGDVYVLDQRSDRVEKFSTVGHFELSFAVGGDSVAVGPDGDVYVGEEGAVHKYSPEGVSLATVPLEEAGLISDLAVGGSGELFVVGSGAAHEYSAAGTLMETFHFEPETRPEALALGVDGQVFIDVEKNGETSAGSHAPQFEMLEFDSAASETAGFDTGPVSAGEPGEESEARLGAAFGTKAGELYLVANGGFTGGSLRELVRVVVPPAPGPVVIDESTSAVKPTSAVVHALVDPEAGEESNEAHYRVEYGTTTAYGSSAPVSDGMLAGSFEEDPITVPLAGLQPATTYHYRVVATDECEREKGVNTTCTTDGTDETVTTLPPLLIESESVTDVKSTSATLQATINPLGSDATYRFAYGPTAACGGTECDAPIPDGDVGSGKGGVEVTPQHVQGLSPGTLYHYRVIAHNVLGTIEGEERSFTTQSPGEAGLPDAREWELVSPQDKHGAEIGDGGEYGLFQASPDGDRFALPATTGTEAQEQGSAGFTQVLSTRGAAGWSSQDLDVPHSGATGVLAQMEYPFFSEDLSLALLDPFGSFEPGLSLQASEQTPYVRDLVAPSGGACSQSCFQPLVTGCPALGAACPMPVEEAADVPPGTVFGPEEDGECISHFCGPRFLDATPDLSHVVIESSVALTRTTIPGIELYEWEHGELRLVTLLPPDAEGHEEPTILAPNIGFKGEITAHAISNDGSRIFWEAENTLSEHTLYMRDMVKGETILIGAAPFEGANAEGSRVFYAGRECDIVESHVTGKLECPVVSELNDRVLGTSEDGSWVYSERGSEIDVSHDGVSSPVAHGVSGLRAAESLGLETSQIHHWRVSPDGEWFAFMSSAPLTGYDNDDATTGIPDEEVFLYDARDSRLVCASCNPTGERPRGVSSGPSVQGWAEGTSSAADVPGWTPYANRSALYQPRYLSDDGRLFFNSTDALVPRDVNGQRDVYEYEPEGFPGGSHMCTRASTSGSVVYVAAAQGCVGLISSGESPEESSFIDASESGGDVFFLSTGKLTPSSGDGSAAVFDAHECTAASPCLPATAGTPRPCDTEASCKASPTPQPPIFGASGSATFSGAGNPAPPALVVRKLQTRAQKLAGALKLCRTKRSKKRRVACEKQARKRDGVTKLDQSKSSHRKAN